jgi:hypothetical protein
MPSVAAIFASPAVTAAPVATGAPASQPPASADCQTARAQLAICMAFHPTSDEKDVQLSMCRGDLDLYKNRPTLPDCYELIDLAPVYDRELGEAEPSPATIERAGRLSIDECLQVMTWAGRAENHQDACLKGPTPPGFKERYGSPIRDRPFVKACRAHGSALVNAWFARQDAQIRETGHEPGLRTRMDADGGIRIIPQGMRSETDAAGDVHWFPSDAPSPALPR